MVQPLMQAESLGLKTEHAPFGKVIFVLLKWETV